MTSAGGDFFSVGDDYIAARLSIDVPSESIQGLRDITSEVERFRTSMEAAARSEADVSRYLDQMTEAQTRAADAQRELGDQLERFLSLSGKMQATPSEQAGSWSVPQGYRDPFEGMTAGMGGRRSGSEGYEAPGVRDYENAQATEALRERDPRAYINMQAQRGNMTAGESSRVGTDPKSISDLADAISTRQNADRRAESTGAPTPGGPTGSSAPHPVEQWGQRAQQGLDLGRQVLNEMGGAGGGIGVGAMAKKGVDLLQQQMDARKQQAKEHADQVKAERAEAAGGAAGGSGGSGGAGSTADGDEDGDGESVGDEATGLLKHLPVIGGAVAAASGIYKSYRKLMHTVQAYRNLGSITGGSAGEGFSYAMDSRLMEFAHPWMTGGQSRQITQALLQEGDHGDPRTYKEMQEFYVNNLQHRNMSPGMSTAIARGMIQTSSDSMENLANKRTVTGDLDVLRRLSAQPGARMSQQDMDKAYAQTGSSLVAQGADPTMASHEAVTATQMFSGDQSLKGSFASGSSTGGGDMLLWTYSGFGPQMTADGVWPQDVVAWLTDHGKLSEARENTLRARARYYAKMFPGSEKKDDPKMREQARKAARLFQKDVAQILPDSEAAHDLSKAMNMFWAMLGSQTESSRATKRAEKGSKPGMGEKLGHALGLDTGLGPLGGPLLKVAGDALGEIGNLTSESFGRNDPKPGMPSGQQPVAPSGSSSSPSGPAPRASGAKPAGFHSGGGQATVHITGNPKLLAALGLPSEVPLSANEQQANAGYGQAQKNDPPPGSGVTTRGVR